MVLATGAIAAILLLSLRKVYRFFHYLLRNEIFENFYSIFTDFKEV
jgi:hypothetical protein